MSHIFITSLFNPTPSHWGLRGDPYLWEELRSNFIVIALPDSAETLQALLEKEFEKLTGSPINTAEKIIVIERLAHGGMSSGGVSVEFWREAAIPLLINRYNTTTSQK